MGRSKSQVSEGEKLINSAVQDGISAITQHHPRFRRLESYIVEHIDKKRLTKKAQEVYGEVRRRGDLDNQEKSSYVHRQIANYVSSGAAFDDEGKEVILKKGLEEKAKKKGFFGNIFDVEGRRARGELESEKYLDNVMVAFQDLYSLFKTGDYAQRMPEVADAVSTVYDMGFLDPAVDILKHRGLIDGKRYGIIKSSIREKTKHGIEKTVSGMEQYSQYDSKKITAAFLGIFGIGILVSFGTKITGGAIGVNQSNAAGAVAGLILLAYSTVLFLRSFKN